jgi:hypothetical protein
MWTSAAFKWPFHLPEPPLAIPAAVARGQNIPDVWDIFGVNGVCGNSKRLFG